MLYSTVLFQVVMAGSVPHPRDGIQVHRSLGARVQLKVY